MQDNIFIPFNLCYTTSHLWLREVGRQDAYIGITEYAQQELGRIDSIEIKNNERLKLRGDTFVSIYGANKYVELVLPFSGSILMCNQEVLKHPGVLNSEPYSNWIILLSASNILENGVPKFQTSKEYEKTLKSLKVLSK